jgi:uncharacterized protein YgiM (DUF1202 family)
VATKKLTKRRLWILGAGVVLAVLVLASQRDGGFGGGKYVGPDGVSTVGPCTVKVTADTLNVRFGPDDNSRVVDTVTGGAKISADRTVRNGFRQLGANRWAAQRFLEPVAGSNCG